MTVIPPKAENHERISCFLVWGKKWDNWFDASKCSFGGMPDVSSKCFKRYKYPPSKDCQSIRTGINHVFIFRWSFCPNLETGYWKAGMGCFNNAWRLSRSGVLNHGSISILGANSLLWEAILCTAAFLISTHLRSLASLPLSYDNRECLPELSKCSPGNKIISDWQLQL